MDQLDIIVCLLAVQQLICSRIHPDDDPISSVSQFFILSLLKKSFIKSLFSQINFFPIQSRRIYTYHDMYSKTIPTCHMHVCFRQ